MPYRNVPDELQDKMESCVQQVMEKGQDKETAIAICYTSVVEGKSLEQAMKEYSLDADAIKVGARHSQRDQRALQDIHDAAITLGAACPPSPSEITSFPLNNNDEDKSVKAVTKSEADGNHPASHYLIVEDPESPTTWHLRYKNLQGDIDHGLCGSAWAALHEGFRGNKYEGPNKQAAISKLRGIYENQGWPVPGGKSLELPLEEDAVITFGSEVKALGDGKLGGYLVRWGSENDPDISMERDYFTPDTDFDMDFPANVTTYWNHGLDPVLKKRKLSKAEVHPDEVGLWIETILQERDAYEKYIIELAKAGKLGWSSGSASHLVEREPVGSAHKIIYWPIIDASITHIPAEPRNTVIPLKSLGDYIPLIPDPKGEAEAAEAAPSEGTGEAAEDPPTIKGVIEMAEPSTVDIDKLVADASEKAAASAVAQFAAKLTTTNEAGYLQVTRAEEDIPFPSLGSQLMAVKTASLTQGREVKPRLKALTLKATGLNELVGSEGGFLLEPSFVETLLKPLHDAGPFSSRANKLPIGPNANGVVIHAVDETSRATGSRWGGIRGYRLAEAGTKTSSLPAFRRMELRLKKYAVLCYATDELLEDATALASIIQQGCAEELDFMVNDDILNGAGNSGPLGILNSGCLISVTKESGQAAATVVLENILKMWARMHPKSKPNAVWFVNTDITPQLYTVSMAVGTGGMPMFMMPGSLPEAPSGALLGKPVVETEFNATLGTVGDILLADMTQYAMIDRDVQAASSIHVSFVTDETAFRFVYRVDGRPKLDNPLTPYKGTSNTLSPFVALATRA